MAQMANSSASMQSLSLSLSTRPESLTRSVFDTIRAAIVDKSLPAGSRVTEASLAEQLDVSKTPVREALLELRQAGLIEDWGRRGGRIVAPSVRLLREISETREALEVFLAGRVAEVASDEQRQSIREIALKAQEVANTGDSDHYHQVNMLFYVYLAEILDNNMIKELVEKYLTLGAALRLRDFPGLSPLGVLAKGLITISNAILERSPKRAEEAARDRVRLSLEFNLSAFHESEGQKALSP